MSSSVIISCRRGFALFTLLFSLFFTASAPAALDAAQEARVDAMLTALGKQSSLIFVRNGSEHNAAEAEAHLRLKLSKTRKRVDTAEQFIDNVAAKSSITGTPYEVKIPGKGTERADVFLHALLQKVDAGEGTR